MIIHSCKKENNSNKEPVVNDPTVSAAKTWYQSTYPVSAAPAGKLTTQSVGSSSTAVFNYSKFINPDWQHAASYTREKTGVIELPIDPASAKIGSAFRNLTSGKVLYKQKYSRSSFLLLKDSTQYQAYIMTIIADSAYLKNDLSKLALNTYRKRDADFSGVVVYFTPAGKFVSSYGYKNGQLIPAPSAGKPASGQGIQSVNDPRLKTDEVAACDDWYLDTYENDELVSSVYLYTICNGDGSEAGGSSPPPVPVPCAMPPPSQYADAVHFVTNVAAPPGDGGGAGGGFPPPAPAPQPCTTTTTVITADTTLIACNEITLLNQNTDFQAAMKALKADINTSYESSYSIQNNNGTISYNLNNLGKDGVNSGNIPGLITSNSIGFIHNHDNDPNDLSIFSPGDVRTLYANVKNGTIKNTSTFTFAVVTASGTTYSLVIDDPHKFQSWGDTYFANNGLLFNSLYNNNVNASNTVAQNEAGFLAILNASGSGLTLLKGDDSSFNAWKTVIKDSNNNIIYKDCNL
ncbi:hypothetical protein ACPPVU_23495 [Mucilaginibacter sp. McL0603]|uniref:hypothetical protein n=1 Tax=Mucilaginibacter sp. McL0603 TaxID=3415670 RepID=UPI003CE79F1E